MPASRNVRWMPVALATALLLCFLCGTGARAQTEEESGGNGQENDKLSVPVSGGAVPADQSPPTVTISGPTDARTGAFQVTITFLEAVTGFEQADVTVGNGGIIAFAGSGAANTLLDAQNDTP